MNWLIENDPYLWKNLARKIWRDGHYHLFRSLKKIFLKTLFYFSLSLHPSNPNDLFMFNFKYVISHCWHISLWSECPPMHDFSGTEITLSLNHIRYYIYNIQMSHNSDSFVSVYYIQQNIYILKKCGVST